MSISVENLLHLPSLHSVVPLSGEAGMNRVVSAITVLETLEMQNGSDSTETDNQFYGGEFVLTSLFAEKKDVDWQCKCVRRLSSGGAAGLLLLGFQENEQVAPCVKQTAESLSLPLLMPIGKSSLRYSEIIRDVMEAILRDQGTGESIVVEVLEQISRLPKSQQTMNMVLKVLSDRIRATLILTDENFDVQYEAPWPHTHSGFYEYLRQMQLPQPFSEPVKFPFLTNGLLYRAKLHNLGTHEGELFIIRDGIPMQKKQIEHTADSVQLAAQIWGNQQDRAAISELLQSIMQDEPLKTRRLAELFHIDIASLRALWILSPARAGEIVCPSVLDQVRQIATYCSRQAFADIFRNHCILLSANPNSISQFESLKEDILWQLPDGYTLSVFTNLVRTADIRNSFLANAESYQHLSWGQYKAFKIADYKRPEILVDCQVGINTEL